MTLGNSDIKGLTGLKKRDPEAAMLASLCLSVLNADGESAVRLSAEGITPSPDGLWLETESGATLRIDQLNGTPFGGDATRLTEIAQAIDSIDPCLTQMEALLGVSLEPIGLAATLPEASLGLRIVWPDQSGALSLCIPTGVLNPTHIHAALGALVPRADQLPVILTPSILTSGLPLDQAAAIDAGDLLLLGQHVPARLDWADGQCRGGLHLSTGQFQRTRQDGTLDSGDLMTEAAGQAGTGLSVPLTVSLPSSAVSAETLASLAPGAVLPLGPITDGMPVILSVGGRELARGELVQVGDRFAVLVESRTTLADDVRPAASEA